jgi:hypothetical protein
MHKNKLLVVLMLVSGLLAAQPDKSPAAVKANDDFNRFIIEEIKAGKFSSVYRHVLPGFDTMKLGQTLSRYAVQVNNPEYKVFSMSHGWARGGDMIYRAMYYNDWKINETEKFSIEILFYKKNDSFVIDRLNFSCMIPELFSPGMIAADSLNKIICKAVKEDDAQAVYNLFRPGININKAQLTKTIQLYSKAIADTNLSYNKGSGQRFEHFPVTSEELLVSNNWEKERNVPSITIDVEVVNFNGKYGLERIAFTSSDERLESIEFPGSLNGVDKSIPPPPPPPPPPIPR